MDPPVPVVTPPQVPAPQTLVCANCHAPLSGDYCAACGQRHEPHVHTLGHFIGEAFESITHADSRLWRTIWYLLAKPGRLTREFFEGHRVRYLPPFRLYLVISLLFFVIIALPGRDDPMIEISPPRTAEDAAQMRKLADELDAAPDSPLGSARGRIAEQLRSRAGDLQPGTDPDPAGPVSDPDPAAGQIDPDTVVAGEVEKGVADFCAEFDVSGSDGTDGNKNREAIVRKCRQFAEGGTAAWGEAIARNIPKAMFVFLPVLAFCMWLIYWRPKRYYVEHLLFMVHNHAFVFLLLGITMLIAKIPVIRDHSGWLYTASFTYIVWYLFRAMRNVYAQGKALTLIKFLALGFTYVVAGFAVFLLTAIYSVMVA